MHCYLPWGIVYRVYRVLSQHDLLSTLRIRNHHMYADLGVICEPPEVFQRRNPLLFVSRGRVKRAGLRDALEVAVKQTRAEVEVFLVPRIEVGIDDLNLGRGHGGKC